MQDEQFGSSGGGLRTHTVFTHVLVAKAELYRAILEVFVRSREQFMTHLRPAEVARKIGCDEEETENALRMLQQWGNLEATQDSAEAAALEEFYRSRFLRGWLGIRLQRFPAKYCAERDFYRRTWLRCGSTGKPLESFVTVALRGLPVGQPRAAVPT